MIVDCCAVGRKQSSGREASASLIGRQIVCAALSRLCVIDGKSLVVFCFDSAEHHTPMRAVCSERRYARPTPQRLAQARPQIESGALQLHGGRLYRPEDAPYSDQAVSKLTIHSEVCCYCYFAWTRSYFVCRFDGTLFSTLLEEKRERGL